MVREWVSEGIDNKGTGGRALIPSVKGGFRTGYACSDKKPHRGDETMALAKCKECSTEISKKAEKCPKCGAPQKRRTSIFTWIVGLLFVGWVVSLVTGTDYDAPQTTDAPRTTDTSTQERGPRAIEAVNLEDFSFSVTGANRFLFNGTIKNDNDFPVGDIMFRCTTYGETNTALNRLDYTVRSVLPPGDSLQLEEINMGFADPQTSRASCRTVTVTQ